MVPGVNPIEKLRNSSWKAGPDLTPHHVLEALGRHHSTDGLRRREEVSTRETAWLREEFWAEELTLVFQKT